MALSRDGRHLLTNTSFKFPALHLWDIQATSLQGSYFGHKQQRFEVECAFGGGPSEPFVLAGSEDGAIFIWSKATRHLVTTVHGHVGTVNSLQWHPHHPNLCISASDDRTLRFWGAPNEWPQPATFTSVPPGGLSPPSPSDDERRLPAHPYSDSDD